MKQRPQITRAFDLLDMQIERGGDGRTVTAYAATFADPYEVRDVHGHYYEEINRSAFNRTISRGIEKVGVFYNHGRTLDGQPSSEFSIPIGVPLEIKPDGKGLLTVTRYSKSPTAERILQDIRDGVIRTQSFRGPIFQDAPPRRHQSGLPLVERMQLGLIEYGPAGIPINHGAEMMSVRSMTDLLTVDIEDLSDEERAELRAALDAHQSAPPPAPVTDGTADGPVVEAPPAADPASSHQSDVMAQARRRVA